MNTLPVRRGLRVLLVGAALVFASFPVRADDTDIYLNPSVPAGGEPLVMFVLDWRPNLGSTVSCPAGSYCDELRATGYLQDGRAAGSGISTTFFHMLRAVLLRVLDPLEGVRIGFMLNHSNQNNCAGYPPQAKCSNGAYVLFGFNSMTGGTDDPDTWQTTGEDPDKVALATKLMNIPMPQGNQAHPFQGKELYFELFRYLTGQNVYNGHTGFIDFGDGPNDNVNLDVDRPQISWDSTIEVVSAGTPNYVSPLLTATQCSKIFVINLMFQVSQQEDDSDAALRATKASGGLAGINLAGNNNTFANVIQYMNDVDLADGTFGTAPDIEGDQNVVSYFIVDPTKINQTTTGYAAAGGTGVPLPLSDDPALLIDTLTGIFKSILSVSTTFVAPSVPVNVFNRSQILNEVFLALFEADEDGLPFWPGNLKKLVIADNASTGEPELQDVNGINAIDFDGRIRHNALTYWTDASTLPSPVEAEVAGADGRAVMRGGVGQKIPGFVTGSPGIANSDSGARILFTEDSSDTTDGLMPLNGDGTTAAALWTQITADWNPAATAPTAASATAAERDRATNDLRYARGLAALNIADTTTERAWFLGDPLHSRPRPINYGARGGHTTSNPDIRIMMGTTDGQMHLFRNTTNLGVQAGTEVWSFLPRAALSQQDRLRQAQTGTPVHPIALDGSPAVLTIDTNYDGTISASGGDRAIAFFGMRRGGKNYYALDITDPDAPKFLWRVGPDQSDFAELGQSWSTPVVGRIDSGSGPRHVIVVSGGYNGDDDGDNTGDLGKDAANRNGTAGTDDDEGNAVFIIDALTGSLVWKTLLGPSGYSEPAKAYGHPDLKDSVAADVAAADTDGDGLLDRLYFADTGGVVWRGDLAGTLPEEWTVAQLFNAGRHFDVATTNDLRFFARPDIVQSRDGNGSFDAVIIGSGDRENPLDTYVRNYFFMIKDRAVRSGEPADEPLTPDDLADLTIDCFTPESCDEAQLQNLEENGWMVALGDGQGEKSLANPITLGGTIFFTTFIPGSGTGSCDLSEGSGRQYAITMRAATPVFNYNLANDEDGVSLDRFDDLASGGIPVEVVPIGDEHVLIQGQEAGQNIQRVPATMSWRTYWYQADER